jgi:hypothetical protein
MWVKGKKKKKKKKKRRRKKEDEKEAEGKKTLQTEVDIQRGIPKIPDVSSKLQK